MSAIPDSFMMRCAAFALAMLLLPVMDRRASAESWTNAAGHAVEAKVTNLKGDLVDFERPDGSTFQLRLGSLAPAHREQIRLAWEGLAIPVGLRSDLNHCRRLLQRLTQLHTAKRLTDEQFATQRQRAVQAFTLCCKREQLDEETTGRMLLVCGALY